MKSPLTTWNWTRKTCFGREGNGFNRVKEEFDHERFLVALTNYGTAMCAFEDAARYANQRVQFGEAIGRFQLIQENSPTWRSN